MSRWWWLMVLLLSPAAWAVDAAQQQLQAYAQSSSRTFSAEEGRRMWDQRYTPVSGEAARSCSSCHGVALQQPGKHVRTGKAIHPMSRKTHPQALSDGAKIEKWFSRNCKWTLGRECSAEEKGDLLSYLLRGE